MTDVFRHWAELPLAEDRTRGWAALRSGGPVVRFDDGTYVLTGVDAVSEAARHPEVFSSADAFEKLGSPLRLIPIAVDPPDHARYRRMLDPFFGPKRMAERGPELRRQLAEIVERIRARGATCDVMPDLAVPFPSQVFLTLFGLPLEDREKLIRWKDSVLAATTVENTAPSPEVLQHAMELFSYLSDHVARRRASAGGNDLLSQLVAARDEGGMTDEEIIGLCFLFVLAGLDTVTSAVGFCFALLGRDSALRRRLAEEPATIPAFVEEILRVEVPVPTVPRIAKEEVVISGTTIPKGAQVILCLGAANRDPARARDPDTFDLDRAANPHYAFGGGPHRCLGSHLARFELQIVLEEWHRRISDYELVPGTRPRVRWPASTLTLESVPLVIRA
ncbi:MAG: cytochrome P450 [Candidatus Binatia bacterium]